METPSPGQGHILTLTCADRVGIVAGVTGFLATRDGFILDSQQYADLATGRFFMRVAFKAGGPRFPAFEDLRAEFAAEAASLGLEWALHPAGQRPRILVAVTTASHCLSDLLHRWEARVLPVDIAGVVSNRPDLARLAERHGIPFHHLPVDDSNRAAQEEALLRLVEGSGSELLVLARYMQLLSPALAGVWRGAASTSITASFPASGAPGPITRPMPAA